MIQLMMQRYNGTILFEIIFVFFFNIIKILLQIQIFFNLRKIDFLLQKFSIIKLYKLVRNKINM